MIRVEKSIVFQCLPSHLTAPFYNFILKIPALSNRKKAAKSKKRAGQGGFLCNSPHESIVHRREDWDMNALNMNSLIQLSEQSEARCCTHAVQDT